MDLGLSDKVVFVTGSGRGLGRAIVEAFAEENAKVVVTDRYGRSAKKVAEGLQKGRVMVESGDFTQRTVIRRSLRRCHRTFGGIDIVVANLGSGRGPGEWSLGEKEWQRMFSVNLDGARRVVEESVPYMIDQRRGTIIFIASVAGIEALGAPVHYSTAKSALLSYAKNLSKKLAQWDIRVNTICPGNILFPGGTWDLKLRRHKRKTLQMIKSEVPLNRFATPEEIADIVVFLASERASFMTGSCVTVDGGQTSRIL